MSSTHLIIPDMQVRPGAPLDACRWAGQYIIDRKPDVVINLGDFADMESLSSYDRGKKAMEGRRYKADIEAAKAGMTELMKPLRDYNEQKKKNKEKQYHPELHLTLGNHEERILRATNDNAQLDGVVSINDLGYANFGWTVHDFLDIVELDGVSYSHYFYRPKSGNPYSGTIETRLRQIGFTFTQGHEQGKLIGTHELANGQVRRGLVVGSCYLYNPEYLGPQATSAWRGVIMKYEVEGGNYSLMEVPLDFLCRKYEQCSLETFMREKYNVRLY